MKRFGHTRMLVFTLAAFLLLPQPTVVFSKKKTTTGLQIVTTADEGSSISSSMEQSTDSSASGENQAGAGEGQTAVKQPSTEQPPAQETSAEQSSTEQPPAQETSSEQPPTQEPSTEQSSTEQPPAQEPSTEQSSAEQPSGKEPSSEQPSAEAPSGEEPSAEAPSAEEPSAEEPSGEEPSGEQPSAEEPSTEEPSGEESSAEEPSAEQPSGEELSGEETSASPKETDPLEEGDSSEEETSFYAGDPVMPPEESPVAPSPEEGTSSEETSGSQETAAEETSPEETIEAGEALMEENFDIGDFQDPAESSSETTAARLPDAEADLGPTLVYHVLEPNFTRDFRFTKIAQTPAILKGGEKIYSEKSTESAAAGEASGDALVYVIQRDQEWYYVESGYVRGFARASALTTGAEAEKRMDDEANWMLENRRSGLASPYGRVVSLVHYLRNPAFTYTLTTTNEVLTAKNPAICREAGAITEDTKGTGRVIGTVQEGTLVFLLADFNKEVVFVESGNVRGFMQRSLLITGDEAAEAVAEKGEKNFDLAEEKIAPEKNRALYFTMLSAAEPGDSIREGIVAFALQVVGNPYKWGGTSLTEGADCSGFIQTVYAHFGYSLPRTSGPQSQYGIEVLSMAEARPADIICYKGHVAIYIGNGEIVHASNSKPYPQGGIKVSKVNFLPIIGIRRIIP